MPSYLERMVGALRKHGASLVTLGSWIEFHALPGRCRRYGTSPADPPSLLPLPPDQYHSRPLPAHSYLWGFGFSYVHTAKLAQCCPYPPSNMGEVRPTAFALLSRLAACILPAPAQASGSHKGARRV